MAAFFFGFCGCGFVCRNVCTTFTNSGSLVGSGDFDMAKETIKMGKLEAARRQLRTAISLWFSGGDPVAIHTLAFAAYDVIHTISAKRDPNRRDLLFDTDWIKDEYRRDWHQRVRQEANFFKHADRDGDSVIDFNPTFADWFIFFAILGRELCGEEASTEESAFMWWFQITRPDMLTEHGRQFLAEKMPVDNVEYLRTRPKGEFFEAFCHARLLAAQKRQGRVLRFPLE